MEDPELTSKFHLSLPLLTEVYRAIALLFKYVPNKRNLLSVLPLRELSVELVLPGLPHELRDVVVLLPQVLVERLTDNIGIHTSTHLGKAEKAQCIRDILT